MSSLLPTKEIEKIQISSLSIEKIREIDEAIRQNYNQYITLFNAYKDEESLSYARNIIRFFLKMQLALKGCENLDGISDEVLVTKVKDCFPKYQEFLDYFDLSPEKAIENAEKFTTHMILIEDFLGEFLQEQ